MEIPAMAKEIKLCSPETKGTMSFEEALAKRRSVRIFKEGALPLEQLSQLLWAAQGITEKDKGYRTAPSAGAIFPMELYVLTKDGFYHYKPFSHRLELISENDLRNSLSKAAFSQSSLAEAQADFVICAVYEKIKSRYGLRGERYAYMEAGHIAQNIHLQAATLELGSVPIGAFEDDEVKKTLNLPEGIEPLYIIPVGYPEK